MMKIQSVRGSRAGKRLRVFLVSLAVSLLFLTALFPSAYAAGYDDSELEALNAWHSLGMEAGTSWTAEGTVDPGKYDGIREYFMFRLGASSGSLAWWAFSMYATAQGLSPDSDLYGSLEGALYMINLRTPSGRPFISYAEDLYASLRAVGASVMVLYFLIELLGDAQAEQVTAERFVRRLVMLAVSVAVLFSGPAILTGIINLGEQLTRAVQESVCLVSSGGMRADLKAVFITLCGFGDGIGGFFRLVAYSIGMTMSNLVSFLIIKLSTVFIKIIAYSRMLELFVRYIFAPLGCAGLVSGRDAAHNAGMRYIRRFAACALRTTLLVASVGAARIITSAVPDSLGLHLVVPLALIGFSLRAGQIAEDVAGGPS